MTANSATAPMLSMWLKGFVPAVILRPTLRRTASALPSRSMNGTSAPGQKSGRRFNASSAITPACAMRYWKEMGTDASCAEMLLVW